MEKLTALINQKFDSKFLFLKLLEIVYSKNSNTCTISFLYHENQTLSYENKECITNYLTEVLALNAKIIVKFKKSFIDKELITGTCLEYFKNNRRSIASVIKKDNISVVVNPFNVKIAIILPKQILENFNLESVSNDLACFLKIRYIAEFECEFKEGDKLDELAIEKSIDEEVRQKLKHVSSVKRYRVFGAEKLIGKDITPEPEYMVNIHESKNKVILAGKVSRMIKKTYKRQYKSGEVEKTYYKFTLNEGKHYINMLYFSPKSNVDKMDKIQDGDEVLLVADIKKENGFLTGFVSDISFCEINEDVRKGFKEKITSYRVVHPEKYNIISQANIFEEQKEIDDYVVKNSFVVFDCETTGLDSSSCEIIEIGAVKIVNGVITEKFQSLVKPKEEISHLITELTTITNEMVENAPKIEEVIKDFFLFSQDSILAGYNVNFDIQFIQNAAKNVGIRFNNEVYDVMVLARQKVHSKKNNLSAIVKSLNLELDNAHRAFYDALATAEVFLKLMTK